VGKEAPVELVNQSKRASHLAYGRRPSFGEKPVKLSAAIARNCASARILVLYRWASLPIDQRAPALALMI
jgi:hypothetical protein